jgi:hypothetical protein
LAEQETEAVMAAMPGRRRERVALLVMVGLGLLAEERAEVEAGEAEIARGEYARWEDVRRTK